MCAVCVDMPCVCVCVCVPCVCVPCVCVPCVCVQCVCVIVVAHTQKLRSLEVDSSDMTGEDTKSKKGFCFYLYRDGDGRYSFKVSTVMCCMLVTMDTV